MNYLQKKKQREVKNTILNSVLSGPAEFDTGAGEEITGRGNGLSSNSKEARVINGPKPSYPRGIIICQSLLLHSELFSVRLY